VAEVTSEAAAACTVQVCPVSDPRPVFEATTSEDCDLLEIFDPSLAEIIRSGILDRSGISDPGCKGYSALYLSQHHLTAIPTTAKSPSVDLNWRPEQSRPGFEWVPYVKPTTTSSSPNESLPCPERACNPEAPAARGNQFSYLNAAKGSL
jgi:hypothetical protein